MMFPYFNFTENVATQQKFISINDVFLAFDPSISVRQIQSFMMIATVRHTGGAMDLVHIKDYFKLTRSQASKMVSLFLKEDYRKKDGLDLISSEPSPRGRGAIAYRLNERGNRLYDCIVGIIQAENIGGIGKHENDALKLTD